MSYNDYFSFATGQASDVGLRREVNEDNLLARPDYGLWVVADGMGGHAAGDVASATIVEALNLTGVPASSEDLRARVMQRLEGANRDILDHAARLDRGMIGATVVALLVYGPHFACIWSGDSRAYLLREGQIVQQSRDHTEVAALLDAGTITAEEARTWPRKNVITRAIGVSDRMQSDIVVGDVHPGDTFILCSDGLTEHLSDDDIAGFAADLPPQQACDAMIRETLARGAHDNVTVIVMQCNARGAGDSGRMNGIKTVRDRL